MTDISDPLRIFVNFRNHLERSLTEKPDPDCDDQFQVLTTDEPFYALLTNFEAGQTETGHINGRYYDFLETAHILRQVLHRVFTLSAYGRKKDAKRLYAEIVPEASRQFTNAFLLWQATDSSAIKNDLFQNLA